MHDLITPLDYLNYFKGKRVIVRTKQKKDVAGILKAFDLNINLGIEVDGNLQMIQGESVLMVSLVNQENG